MVGGGGRAPSCGRGAHPSKLPVGRRALSARPLVTARSSGGGGRGGPLTRPWLRPSQGTTVAMTRLGSM